MEPDTSGTELLTHGALTVLVRRPQASDKPHPALIMLHGWGANESDIYELVPFVDKRVLIVAARGPGKVNDSPRGAWKWYDWSEVGRPEPGLRDTSVEKLGQLIDGLEALTGVAVDPAQVYVGGFSQGAAMSLMLAATYPEKLAGIIVHSGFASPEATDRLASGVFEGKAAFVAHGIQDQGIKLYQGQHVRDVLDAGEVDLTYREYPIAHATSPESRRDLGEWLNQRLHF
jgi:phospholipase/carboxylesterase